MDKSVCMITHDAPYIDRRILLQAKSLTNHGYNVSIIYPFGEITEDFTSEKIEYIPIFDIIDSKVSVNRLKIIAKKTFPKFLLPVLRKIYLLFKKNNSIPYDEELLSKAIEKEYDLYVAHDLLALPIAYEAAKQKSSLLVYDAHEFFLGQDVISKKYRDYLSTIETELIHDVDLMFTVNKDIANLFKETYGVDDIKVLYNSVDEQSEELPKDLHAILDIPKNKKIVLFQGGFSEGRNLEQLVESSQYFSDDFVLVMLGYGALESRLKTLAKKIGNLNRKIYFMDRVPQKQLLAYSAGADFGIIPYPDIDINTKYCTPNKMFEFLTANVPMIANKKLVTVSNMTKEYEIGTVIAFDSPQGIAAEILNVVLSANTVMLKKNMKHALKLLSWQTQEKVLLQAYNELSIRCS